MSFLPVDSKLLFSRNDPHDIRLGDLSKALPRLGSPDELSRAVSTLGTPETQCFVLAGYPDDEGIKINGGRPGAKHAPDFVRKPFYKMTPSLLSPGDPDFRILDCGNLELLSDDLAQRHETVSSYALTALTSGARWLSIGGGHDYGFPDAAAFIEWCKLSAPGQRPLVINFDAHLDVRPLNRGLSSGTPFFRMLEKYPQVDFAEIGIQTQCNSRAHLEWAQSRGARVLLKEETEGTGLSFVTHMVQTLSDWLLRPRPVFLSVDIDAFSSSIAPGCSQSWATGLTSEDFFPALDLLKKRLEIMALGIYEVSPPLDQDDRTSKLAAQILHRVVG